MRRTLRTLLAVLGCTALLTVRAPSADGTQAGRDLAPCVAVGPNAPTPAVAQTPKPAAGVVEFEILDRRGPRAARVILTDLHGRTVGGLPGLGWIWVDGVFSGRLPAGAINLAVSSGPRVAAWHGALRIDAAHPVCDNKLLGTFSPVSHAGWWTCDPYVQADAGQQDRERYSFGSLAEVSLAARGEGVEILGLGGGLNLRTRRGTYGERADGATRLESDLCAERRDRFLGVYAWTERRPGHGILYALEPKPVAPSKATAPLFETIAHVRDRGGVAIWAYPLGSRQAHADADRTCGSEFLFNMVAGAGVDAIDVSRRGDDLRLWWMLLNEGYRVTALAGGPALHAQDCLDIPGMGSYIHLASKKPGPPQVLDAIRRGEVIASNGPFVRLLVDGRGPGATVPVADELRTIRVEALACSDVKDSIKRVDIIYNGERIRTLRGRHLQKALRMEVRESLHETGWIAARYYSMRDELWAMSNPVYIRAPSLSPPRPALAQITVRLLDAATGAPLAGTLEVWNLGVCVQRLPLTAAPRRLELPATVRLRFSAPGYAPQERSVYEHGGPAAQMRKLAAAGKLRARMLSWRSLDALREKLRDVRFCVSLQRSSAAE